jgi:Protein of unknown function (DUF3592)
MGFFKLVCMLAALGVVLWQVHQILLGQASRRWRSTKGKVLRSYVDEQVTHRSYGQTYSSYSANVEYTYHVGTRHFASKHLTYEPTTGLSENTATQLLDGITEGGDVDVFYDPLNWEHSVLIRGTSSGNTLHLGLSIAAFVLVIWLFFS